MVYFSYQIKYKAFQLYALLIKQKKEKEIKEVSLNYKTIEIIYKMK